MNKINLKTLISTINDSPTGGFIGLQGYQSTKGDVTSVVGQLGCSYGKAKQASIQALKEAVDTVGYFVKMTVEGDCYQLSDGTWNSRARSNPLKSYKVDYTADEVLAVAKEILEGWENPKTRKSNGVELSDKENGLVLNTETKTINMTLMIHSEKYDQEASDLLKEDMETKVKAQMPEANLKAKIRGEFERKIKAYTIAEGKFNTLSINGEKFASDEITF